MGVGTWAAFGAGRVLLGAGSVTDNQPVPVTQVFTAGDTEGELSHTNTVAETASHDHKLFADETVAPDYHTSNVTASTSVAKSTGNGQPAEGYITRAGTVDATLGLSSDTGSGDAHNNLQPYIVVYFWKRTA
jgi:microcystin-dependent protein